MVARDIQIAALTGGRVHFLHVSCARSVDLIRMAKAEGVAVTAETCPHYWELTAEAVTGYRTDAKMYPPLRAESDRVSVRAALAEGVIDTIGSDHAPHASYEKAVEFHNAPNGIIGLETTLPLALNLVRDGVIEWSQLVRCLSVNPAAVIGIDRGHLSVGAVADLREALASYRDHPENLPEDLRHTVLDPLLARLGCLHRTGLDYLALDRPLRTLSGGEARRVLLTQALGSDLVNTLYVLDEPTAGLHAEDVERLLEVITELVERGNSVVMVEHDTAVVAAADQVIDIGPGAGRDGGRLVFQGPPEDLPSCDDSLTGGDGTDTLAGNDGNDDIVELGEVNESFSFYDTWIDRV